MRSDFTPERTIGKLYVDDAFCCWTLEDSVHGGPKVLGATAIPAGYYPLVITSSTRFGRLLPLVQSVPGFDGIRIHAGNTAADTSGCILVGETRTEDGVQGSRLALAGLQHQIAFALAKGQAVMLTIENGPPVEHAVKV